MSCLKMHTTTANYESTAYVQTKFPSSLDNGEQAVLPLCSAVQDTRYRITHPLSNSNNITGKLEEAWLKRLQTGLTSRKPRFSSG